MTLPDLSTMFVPIVIILCLCVGYVITATPKLNVLSPFIPIIVAIVGIVASLLVNGLSVDSFVAGFVSGLASTGLNQAFRKSLGLLKEE